MTTSSKFVKRRQARNEQAGISATAESPTKGRLRKKMGGPPYEEVSEQLNESNNVQTDK